jgi:hypothetical protein
MSVIRIKEESPTLSVTFADGATNRPLGKIGHPVEGGIDWRKTAASVKATGKGLEIELIPK